MKRQFNNCDLEEIVKKQFKQNTKDNICAYVSLDFPKNKIPNDYLVIGIEKENNNSFSGVIILKEKLYDFQKNNKRFSTFYIKLNSKASKMVIKTDNSWQFKYGIGILDIKTTDD